ncbi:MAG: DUF1838 domain-containing protein [Alphaproteobacteria bacterium]|nr:DUF1838 domain-containing protein [Alphaproteobacteria bacterium]
MTKQYITPSGATRRQAIASSALGVSAAVLGGSLTASYAATAPSESIDLDDPEHRMTALMKIYGATDDRVCFGYVVGTFYGFVEQQMLPLFGILASTFNRYRLLPDGTYEGRALEIAYLTDLETGERLTSFDNPYTGETLNDIRTTRFGPRPILVGPSSAQRLPVPGVDRVVSQRLLPFRIVNDTVWLVEEIQARFVPEGGSPLKTTSVTNYGAKVSDVLNPDLKTVRTEVSYADTTDWMPWMNMAGMPGMVIGNATGHTVPSMDELPPQHLALTREIYPDVLDDPKALLTFE